AVYAGIAGISQVALLVAVAFWAWLWGPIGILLATPLTVCLAVLGKHIPGLEFVSTLISHEPVLAPEMRYYPRLLAGGHAEGRDPRRVAGGGGGRAGLRRDHAPRTAPRGARPARRPADAGGGARGDRTHARAAGRGAVPQARARGRRAARARRADPPARRARE